MLAAVGVGIAVAFLCSSRRAVLLVCYLIVLLSGFDRVIFAMPNTVQHFGIASGSPALLVSDVVLFFVVLSVGRGARLLLGPVPFVFGVFAVVATVVVWGNTAAQYAGVKLLLTGLLCYAVGRLLPDLAEAGHEAAFTLTCLFVIVLHAGAAILQFFGLAIEATTGPAGAAWVAQGRMVGLSDHPGFLGKTFLLLLVILLPMTTSSARHVRVCAQLAVGVGLIGTLLTVSRANSVGVVAALVLWTLLNSRASVASRSAIVAFSCLTVILSPQLIDQLEARNAEDPGGGYRSTLFETGIDQIQNHPLWGLGVNSYSEVVGRFDEFAARGFPIHNSLLLPVAEIGVPLSGLLLLPIMLSIVVAVRNRRGHGASGSRARALLAVLPGIAVIAWTGWGMVAGTTLPLWFAVFGYARGGAPAMQDRLRQRLRTDRNDRGAKVRFEPLPMRGVHP